MEGEKKDWVDILSKIATPVILAILGVWVNWTLQIQQEKNRMVQLYVEIMSQREQADSNLRTETFKVLIENYLGKPTNQEETKEKRLEETNKKLTFLELLAWNFHDTFNIKPLFRNLKEEIDKIELTIDEKKILKTRLQKIAKEIVNKQVTLLSSVKGAKVQTVLLYEGKTKSLVEKDGKLIEEEKAELKEGTYTFGTSITLLEIKEDAVEVRSTIRNQKEIPSFGVSYYDMPFIDHIRLSNGERFAITLEGIKPSAKAKMQFLDTQIEIEKGEEIFFDDDLNLLKESEISPNTNISYIFKVEEIGDKYVRLKEMDKEEDIEINKENPYSICFDGKKGELHLQQIINEVILNVLLFPGEYASLRDKPYYEEMLEELRLAKKSNGR